MVAALLGLLMADSTSPSMTYLQTMEVFCIHMVDFQASNLMEIALVKETTSDVSMTQR